MDIHKSKPIHNWREFLKEYAIIVLGVATALAGEQAVETLHNRSRAAEARASIREEIAHNLGWMDKRESIEDCFTRKLDEVDGLIAASSTAKLPQGALWIGMPVNYPNQDGKYKAAVQSGAVSLFDDSEQAAYAEAYTRFGFYDQRNMEEIRAWGDLRTLENHPPSSPALDVMLRSAMQQARTARYHIGVTRRLAHLQAESMSIAPERLSKPKQVSACIPLHTPRKEALKQSAVNSSLFHFP
jgi:hypothetical protein